MRPGDGVESPLAFNDRQLVWNDENGVRERTEPRDKPKGKLSFNREAVDRVRGGERVERMLGLGGRTRENRVICAAQA